MNKEFYGDEPTDVDNPEWKPIIVDPKGLIVTYHEKYGNYVDEKCIGLWESASQYLLTNLDSNRVILEKENIDSIRFKKDDLYDGQTKL